MNYYIQVYYIIFLCNKVSIIWKIWDVTLHRSFHHNDWFLWIKVTSVFLHVPYLASEMSLHRPSSNALYLQFHLGSKALLKHPMSLMPKPPTTTGLHTVFHFTQVIFLPLYPQLQRNFAWILLIWLHTTTCALRKEK